MIDSSYLLSLYGLSSGATGGSMLGGAPRVKIGQPTAPWAPKAEVPTASALVRQALGGRRFINESAVTVDQAGAGADYRRLFALYQGMDALVALTNRAATTGVSSTELALINKRFGSGMDEIGAYLAETTFDDFRVVQGVSSSLSKSTAGVARDSAKSITAPIHEGSLSTPVAAFEGDVRFTIKVEKLAGTEVTGTASIDIDLAEMGGTARTLPNVIAYINGKLEAAGVQARVGREQIKAEPKTLEVNGRTVTLPAGADRWALLVRGASVETLEFMAPDTSDAVYVVQGAGAGDGAGHQLLKFQSDGGAAPAAQTRVGETQWVDGRLSQSSMIDGVETVRASATAPDGSLWVLADLKEGSADQPIKGQRDVAVIKYDSAGRVMFTRTLGAADQASGFALSVAEDGRVAIAGSVTGALDKGKAGDAPGVSDSFVTMFDAAGKELWTQRRGARGADEATSVVFGEAGMVYVAGRSQSAMSGAAAKGGWDGYVQGFSQTQAHKYAEVEAKPVSVTQFGTAGTDDVQAMAIDGSTLVTAGVENGRAVVRTFALGVDSHPVLSGTRDLGVLAGEIAGISIKDGRITLAGTTRNAGLDLGDPATVHSGGTDAFVAAFDADLTTGADRLTYYGEAEDDTAADMKMQDGKVWISGVSNRLRGSDPEDPTEAYLTRIDAETGAVEWSRTWKGDGQQAVPMAIAVAKDGASVLDRLGLPTGKISQSDSKTLVEATSVRVGDRFYVSPGDGGRPIAVTIEARDTLSSLARKIEQASRMALKVTLMSEGGEVTGKDGETVTTAGGFQRLSITSRSGKSAVISAGEVGRDALSGLGLSPGFIGQTSTDDDDERQTYGLELPHDLRLNSDEAIKATGEKLQQAMSVLRTIYRDLNPDKIEPLKGGGAVPAYLTNQIANYQAALARLGGG